MNPVPEGQEIREDMGIMLESMALPSFRVALAHQRGNQNKILITTWGGLGDEICSEPTIRYALENFKDVEISLATKHPYLFSHLKGIKKVYHIPKEQPIQKDYFIFDCMSNSDKIQWEFIAHAVTHCVDFPALHAFRMSLPIDYKAVQLPESRLPNGISFDFLDNSVVIHPGKHWPTKTFPVEWWNAVIERVQFQGRFPIIIGASSANTQAGTVDVNTEGCLDLRDRTSIMESAALLRHCKALLTNDSSPLHLAAPGQAWIGFVATCKHQDYITHWRKPNASSKPEWSWRMVNHGKGGIWDLQDCLPNKTVGTNADQVSQEILRSWLPQPQDFADWACSKLL